jgi:hypothetical protein
VPTAALVIHHVDSTSQSAAAPPASRELTGPSQEQPAPADDTAGPRAAKPVHRSSSPSRPASGGSAVTGVGYVQALQSIRTPSAAARSDAGSEVGNVDDQGDDEGQWGKGEDRGADDQESTTGGNGSKGAEHGDGHGNEHGADSHDHAAGRDDTGNHGESWHGA